MPITRLSREDWDDGCLDWLGAMPDCPWFLFWPSGQAHRLLVSALGFRRQKHRQLFWKKLDPMPQPGGRSPYSVEPIWVISKDGIALHGPDWCEDSSPRANRDADATGHPYQKPIGVLLWLLSLTDAATVLDPFAGSGTTGRACKDLGRKCVMIEREERYCEIAARRMGQEVLAL
jgi:site-specific DNA-methyltransferase (adenine-specific)